MTIPPDVPEPGDAAEVDPGPPIAELAGLSEEPSPRFVDYFVENVNRSTLSNNVLEVWWWGVTAFALEFLQSIMRMLGVREDQSREE